MYQLFDKTIKVSETYYVEVVNSTIETISITVDFCDESGLFHATASHYPKAPDAHGPYKMYKIVTGKSFDEALNTLLRHWDLHFRGEDYSTLEWIEPEEEE